MVLSCTVSEIRRLIGWKLRRIFSIPISHSALPLSSLCSVWNFAVKLTARKLELWGYSVVKVAWS